MLRLGLGLGAGAALGALPPGVATALAGPAPAGIPVTKPIPATGEALPVIGIGTARRYDVGDSGYEREPLRQVLAEFPRLGGRLIDTAPSYGRAESVLGGLLPAQEARGGLFLATKVGAGRDGVQAGIDEMEASFRRLRTDRIDLMQVHNLAGVEAMLPVLREWKQAGRLRYVGITTMFKPQYGDLLRVMAREPVDFIQIDYAIDNRSVEERVLPLAVERGIAVLASLPFGRGRVFEALRGKRIPGWAREYGIGSWAQFVLKYVVSHPAVTCAIPGTATIRYLQDNFAAATGPLPDAAARRRMVALLEEG